MANNGYNFKIVLLGEGCVGKTSCVLRYVEDKFNDKHITTLQVKYFLEKKSDVLPVNSLHKPSPLFHCPTFYFLEQINFHESDVIFCMLI